MASKGSSLPCYWPGCGKRLVHLSSLAKHLDRWHNAGGFGCNDCEFRTASDDDARDHNYQQHNSKQAPPKAKNVIARSYRERFQRADPCANAISPGNSLARGCRGSKKGHFKSASESASQERELTSCESESEHDEDDNVSKSSPPILRTKTLERRCPKCDDVITPYTQKCMIQHLRLRHSPMIAELDFDQISRNHTEHKTDEVSAYESTFVTGSKESKPEELGRIHGYEDDNDDNESSEDEQGSQCDSQDNRQVSHHGGRRLHDSAPTSRSDDDSEPLRQTFMKCIVPEAINEVQTALNMHETRAFAGREFRVSRSVPADLEPNFENIVHAILTPVGWNCKVPQCGATFDHDFAIDLHLHAHGAPNMTKWYCGETTCQTGFGRSFMDYQSFEDHVATEHMNSSYSFAAARRVPRQEVLLNRLRQRLKIARIPSSTAVDYEQAVQHTIPKLVEDDECDIFDQECAAWDRFRSLYEVAEVSESSNQGPDDDFHFRERYHTRYVSLWESSTGTDPPLVFPPNYLVEH